MKTPKKVHKPHYPHPFITISEDSQVETQNYWENLEDFGSFDTEMGEIPDAQENLHQKDSSVLPGAKKRSQSKPKRFHFSPAAHEKAN